MLDMSIERILMLFGWIAAIFQNGFYQYIQQTTWHNGLNHALLGNSKICRTIQK